MWHVFFWSCSQKVSCQFVLGVRVEEEECEGDIFMPLGSGYGPHVCHDDTRILGGYNYSCVSRSPAEHPLRKGIDNRAGSSFLALNGESSPVRIGRNTATGSALRSWTTLLCSMFDTESGTVGSILLFEDSQTSGYPHFGQQAFYPFARGATLSLPYASFRARLTVAMAGKQVVGYVLEHLTRYSGKVLHFQGVECS